jgi:exonuclease SbcC
MPISHPKLGEVQERLRRFLIEAFPTPQTTVSPAYEAPHPFLLLRFRHDLAGFAIADGNPQQCFEESYSYFKRLYAERHREWDGLNLVFVLCLKRRDRDLEAFCASVETDVFFCRKFTVALDTPWESELARLPFFPLERRRGASIRPPSAQTLLKAIGVPAPLAAAIVARVGEESILDGCLSGRFGAPMVVEAAGEPTQELDGGVADTIRIQSVEIENFRAYRQSLSFDIDADLVLLYGPNGFGKTSFFDAIDFAATGDIGRLGLATKEERFLKAARHLDATSRMGSVTLTISDGEGTHRIHRTIERRRQPQVDDTTVDRKDALLRLTNPRRSVGGDHVEHLVRLFRATHLFSQEFQELTEAFRQHCRLSTEVVSRMLTFEDYVSARRKVARIVDLLRERLAGRDTRAQELNGELAQDRTEIGRLQEASRSAERPQAIAGLREALFQRLQAAGVDAQEEGDPIAEVRGWRAAIEARIREARARATRFLDLAGRAPRIDAERVQLSALQGEQTRRTAEFEQANRRLVQTREDLARSEAELAALIHREKELRVRSGVLGWLRQTKPAYDALRARSSVLTEEIGALTTSLADHNASLERLRIEAGAVEAQRARAAERLDESRRRVARLSELVARFPRWQECVRRRHEIEQAISENRTLLVDVRRELQGAAEDLTSAKREEQRTAAELAGIERRQTELQQALTVVEAHVRNEECPACGVSHDSREDLVRRLRSQRSATAGSAEVESRLKSIRERIASLTALTDERKQRERSADQTVGALSAELGELEREIAEFEVRLRETDIDPGDSGLDVRLRELLGAGERVRDELAEMVEKGRQMVEAAGVRLAAARADAESRQRDISAKRQALREAGAELERIRRDAVRMRVSLDIDTNELAESERAIQFEAERAVSEIGDKRGQTAGRQTSLAEVERGARLLRAELEAEATNIDALRRSITEYERDCEATGLDSEVNAVEINRNAQRVEQEASEFERLKENAVALEIALDAAARSAASERVATKMRMAEDELRELSERQARDRAWAAYFERLDGRLAGTQDRAVAGYTEKYGPLTSVIQRRLRPVSGFEDISLHPQGDRIEVKVARKGEELPPTDFFSQSQQQILILSLFLTACITQTWSSFAPILLDDPVTHFDDLNAYSFLDLIGGLLETEPESHQFILSTCDERLFLLARQRFQHLGDRAKVYRFMACGSDGPIVDRV